MTTLDENVCINQIRETGVLIKKFNNEFSINAGVELATTRFAVRKNYGSMCV